MPSIEPSKLDLFMLEDVVWIAAAPTGLPAYDFPFQNFFACRHPWQRPERLIAIGRFGVTANYEELHKRLADEGVLLVHSPEQHLLASELTRWYALLEDLTPRSIWFAEPPTVEEIEGKLTWPIFLKGSRQTSRHKAALSIIRSPAQYQEAIANYRKDPILYWQEMVCREFVELRSVGAKQTETIPPSFEFRTFWRHGQCVGAGTYWSAFASYSWNKQEELAALTIAEEAARRLNLPFLVIDVAQTKSGEWIVIECNDGQESGYAGIPPITLWQKMIELERM